MQSKKTSVVTTLPIIRLHDYLDTLLSWAKSYNVHILITISEANLYPSKIQQLRELDISVHPRDFSVLSTLSDLSYLSSPRTPSLALLWDVLRQVIPNGDAAVFTNADIYLKHGEADSLNNLIKYCLNQQRIAFLHRWDYLEDQPTLSNPYLDGFDVLIIPKNVLDDCSTDHLSLFSIGQVGWDYALPLFFDYDKVLRSSSIQLRHCVHATTSTSPWGLAMQQIIVSLGPSHIDRLDIFRRMVFNGLKRSAAFYKFLSMRIRMNSVASSMFTYIFSRIAYYAVIRKLLKNIREY